MSGLIALLLAVVAPTPPIARARPLCSQATRACLVRTARGYFRAILDGNAAAVPFADDVRVSEQGHVVATSRAAFLAEFRSTGATKALRNMRMLVDEATGQVVVLILGDVRMAGQPPFTVRRIQRMRIGGGLIREVELVIYKDDGDPAALWPDDADLPGSSATRGRR